MTAKSRYGDRSSQALFASHILRLTMFLVLLGEDQQHLMHGMQLFAHLVQEASCPPVDVRKLPVLLQTLQMFLKLYRLGTRKHRWEQTQLAHVRCNVVHAASSDTSYTLSEPAQCKGSFFSDSQICSEEYHRSGISALIAVRHARTRRFIKQV